MPTHITARLAWHNDGWNGAVCSNPERNTYCVGCKSFPGDVIARERDLALENRYAGLSGKELKDYVPPCNYSYNAFGVAEAPAASNPPDFFYGGATRRSWTLKPATVCAWPFEAMYSDEVKASGRLDNDARHALTLKFFQPIIDDCPNNLVFYYVNYSNPLSEEDNPRYVFVGVSRITEVGEELFYENVTPKVAADFAGGMVWARDITAAYPDEGVRLPYHRYINDPGTLARIAVFPENPILCKYGSKHLTDDDAIGILEQFLAKVRLLKEMGDETENWGVREAWLLNAIAKLWTHRGLYPGLLKVLEAIGAPTLIDRVKSVCIREGHERAHACLFDFLDGEKTNFLTDSMTEAERDKLGRAWRLQDDDAQILFRDVFPRFALDADVMRAIASTGKDRALDASAQQIAKNPYIICEMFCGSDASDRIPWGTIDRGVLPWPDLGGKPLAEMEFNDARRFRALCVEHVRQEPKHTFRLASDLIVEIATRMARLPAWKQAQFTEQYFKADAKFLSEALTLRTTDAGRLVYLKGAFEDERSVESTLQEMASRPDIDLRRPIMATDWLAWIQKPASLLALEGGEAYQAATREQADICQAMFRRPLAVVTGPAGTGKTTVIEALVRAVRRSEGDGASILVLAPTGKAADRAREVFQNAGLQGVPTVTVHSFLASGGWLNANLTFKRQGGKRAAVGTLILDEASMLDLELAAALMRAVDWQSVRRLILVGDAGQLPPIGRGRLLADVIGWLERSRSESLGRLKLNLRQLLNKLQGQGSSIVELSQLFILDDSDKSEDSRDASTTVEQEELIQRIHAGGAVDRDLDVVYWNEPEELATALIAAVEAKMSGGQPIEEGRAYKLWRERLSEDPTRYQILTPHRGELHGVEALNEACQNHIAEFVLGRLGAVGGITLSDKVIQIRNRPKSNQIWAYRAATKENIQVEVFNGEIGIVEVLGLDQGLWKRLKTGYGPRLKRFAVKFTRKPGLAVNYGNNVPHPGKYTLNEKVEENLELAYAVSIHKAQGSEFEHTFVVIPSCKARPVSAELVYTALTRASRHCTLFIERDVTSLLDARRRENAQTPQINSSLFDRLHIVKSALTDRRGWYEAGKIHESLSGDMLRSKSEVIIANLLHDRDVPFHYELPLFAGDGTLCLPDFTLSVRGLTYYWEHLGMLDTATYAEGWSKKKAWYDRWFPGQLITTEEGPQLSRAAAELLASLGVGRV